jgi:hypothetical protein
MPDTVPLTGEEQTTLTLADGGSIGGIPDLQRRKVRMPRAQVYR